MPVLPLGNEICMFNLGVSISSYILVPHHTKFLEMLCVQARDRGIRSTWSASVRPDITKTDLDLLHEHPHALVGYIFTAGYALCTTGMAFLLLPW